MLAQILWLNFRISLDIFFILYWLLLVDTSRGCSVSAFNCLRVEVYSRGQTANDLKDIHGLLKKSNHMWNIYHMWISSICSTSSYQNPWMQDCPDLMRASAAALRNNIHSGVFNLHSMKEASLSEDYVFADCEEGIIAEATACWCGKSLLKIPHREAK